MRVLVRRRSQWFAVSAALSAAVFGPLVACSSAPSQTHEGSPSESHGGPATAAPPASGASTTEAERVHAHLEGRYPSSAVRYSFHTALGQTADCVDYFQMPSVREMAAQGHPLTEIPKPPSPQPRRLRDGSIVVDPPQPAPASEGVDDEGHERLCPEGTVPQVRVTPEEIARAGGLDAYLHGRRKHPRGRAPSTPAVASAPAGGSAPVSTPPTMWPCESGEFHDYAHVQGDVVDQTPGVEFAMDTMAVYSPALPQEAGNHNVGQVWAFGGTIAQDLPTDPGCDPATMDCVQSIEIGWIENTEDTPTVFIYSTLDGYTAGPNGDLDGCWNGEATTPTQKCPTFQWSSGFPTTVTPGFGIAVNGPFAQPAQELSALIIDIAGDYWVQIGIGGNAYYIGYYPGSQFKDPISNFQVGGEVFGANNDFTNPAIPMGSGFPAQWGYGWAAYHYGFNATVYANGQSTNYWGASSMCASTPPNYASAPYGYSTTPPAGSSSWTTLGGYFYYGGTPSACTPTTCAAAGATCGSIADGCGNTVPSCGTCGAGTTCVDNTCRCSARRCPVGDYWNYTACACERRFILE